MQQTKPPFGPEQLMQLHMSMVPARVLSAALRFDVFRHLEEGRDSAEGVAEAAGASPRGIRMLLDVLTALGLVEKRAGSYRAAEPARRYLLRSSEDYMGTMLEQDHLWQAWMALPEVIGSGKPARRVGDQQAAEAFFPALVQALHVVHREPSRRAAAALTAGGKRGLRVLDVASGSGIWGIAIAEADPEARVTAQDFPGLLPVTRRYAERHGVAGRFDYLGGDLKQVAFPAAAYDLALLGNIVHSEGEAASRALFARLRPALRPGGRIAIIDMIPNDERTGPPYPLIFALNMLLNTEAGDTYTRAQYADWLAAAGFDPPESADIGSHSPMLVARRRD
ncbi:MAG TPA: methyltransferase [Steroidobacteraceae bacterium]|nr:methyltransferase [Steroidobacteraceae bacterium]